MMRSILSCIERWGVSDLWREKPLHGFLELVSASQVLGPRDGADRGLELVERFAFVARREASPQSLGERLLGQVELRRVR